MQSTRAASNEQKIEAVRRAVVEDVIVDHKALFKSLFKSLPMIPKRKRVRTPRGASATERRVRAVLRGVINEDNSIGPSYGHYMAWDPGDEKITLDSQFTVEELEALAWWMRNKKASVALK